MFFDIAVCQGKWISKAASWAEKSRSKSFQQPNTGLTTINQMLLNTIIAEGCKGNQESHIQVHWLNYEIDDCTQTIWKL